MRFRYVLNPIYVYRNRDLIQPAFKDRYRRFLLFRDRFLGRLGIPVTENGRRVSELKNKYKGRRCFIIGNGPSLKVGDLNRLKSEVTFASNKIYLAFDSTEWRPTYYSVIDVLVAENNSDEINKLDLYKIFLDSVKPYFNDSEDILWIHALRNIMKEADYVSLFSKDLLKGVYGGWSVMVPQIQIASYMGFKEIYLIGLDFSFDVPKSSGRTCAHGEILEHGGETNHFHAEYRKLGETWTIPQLDLQYKAFIASKEHIEANGGAICNASRKTALDVFPLVKFDSIVS